MGAAAAVALAAVGFLVLRSFTSGPVPWAVLGTADVHALAFSADDPDHLYFGHHGGLLESSDGGRSWSPTPLEGVDAMQASTGSGDRMQIAGHGVYVESTDGGATWQAVDNDLPGLDLHAFVTDPADSDHAWTFAVGFGLFETADAGRSWDRLHEGNWGSLTAFVDGNTTVLVAIGPDGLVSSRDDGLTWTPMGYPGPLSGALASSADGSVMYAPTVMGLRRSSDQGATWEDTGFQGAVLSVAVSPHNSSDVIVVDENTYFYRSPDRGASWPDPR